MQKLYSSKNPLQPWPLPLSSSSSVVASPPSTAHKIPLWGLIKKDAKTETNERKEGEEAPIESQGYPKKKRKSMRTFQLYLQQSTDQKSNRKVQKVYNSKNPPQPWPPPLSSSSTVVASPPSTTHKIPL